MSEIIQYEWEWSLDDLRRKENETKTARQRVVVNTIRENKLAFTQFD